MLDRAQHFARSLAVNNISVTARPGTLTAQHEFTKEREGDGMKRTTAAALALGLTMTATSAGANTKRSPLWTGDQERETELSLERWDTPAVVERQRTFGRKNAVFHADPQTIAPNAVLVFEVVSEGELRWRCVAVDDVAECLGAPVRIPYQKNDEILRLSVKAVPRDTAKGSELVREAKQGRNLRLIAKG